LIIISISNIKGGTGKTTTAINLTGELAKQGYKVCLLDNDPQSNSTQTFSIATELTLYDIYTNKKIGFEECLVKINDNVSIIPNKIRSAKLDREINSRVNREQILLNKLETLKTKFDFVIIDNTPFDSIVLKNALAMSDYYISIIDNCNDSLAGLEMLEETVTELKEDRVNDNIECLGILRNCFDKVSSFSKQFSEVVEETYSHKLFKTIIYNSVKYKEARSLGKFIQDYSKEHAQPYEALLNEVLNKLDVDIKN